MSIPSRVEAAAVLAALRPNAKFIRHACAVAEIAAFLAKRIDERGISVDRRLVESAALLHDVDKVLPRGERPPGDHGDAGAAWLTARGYPELGRPVANHPVSRLGDDKRYRRWASFASREERILAYADKRAAQHLQPMDARFARWYRRHPEYAARLDVARQRAARLERDICEAAGVRPEEVRRLRWVARALAEARSSEVS